MKALSLWEPHATAIALGLKPWETRGWFLDYRGPLAVQASKKLFREKDYDWNWYCEATKRLSLAGCPRGRMSYGKITCIVDVIDCVPTATVREMAEADRKPDGLLLKFPAWYFWGDFRDRGDDDKPRFAFKLANVRKIPFDQRPEVVGRQGLFEVPNEIGLWG
jgi:activating signal cointegrator 1